MPILNRKWLKSIFCLTSGLWPILHKIKSVKKLIMLLNETMTKMQLKLVNTFCVPKL